MTDLRFDKLTAGEFIRVWAHEVPEYEAQGWQLQCVRQGKPCEVVLGPDYADCLMVRTRTPVAGQAAACLEYSREVRADG